jgi:hypothetical protein
MKLFKKMSDPYSKLDTLMSRMATPETLREYLELRERV